MDHSVSSRTFGMLQECAIRAGARGCGREPLFCHLDTACAVALLALSFAIRIAAAKDAEDFPLAQPQQTECDAETKRDHIGVLDRGPHPYRVRPGYSGSVDAERQQHDGAQC